MSSGTLMGELERFLEGKGYRLHSFSFSDEGIQSRINLVAIEGIRVDPNQDDFKIQLDPTKAGYCHDGLAVVDRKLRKSIHEKLWPALPADYRSPRIRTSRSNNVATVEIQCTRVDGELCTHTTEYVCNKDFYGNTARFIDDTVASVVDRIHGRIA